MSSEDISGIQQKQRILIVGHLPPAAGGITSLLLAILRSTLSEQFLLIPFNIGRPAKHRVTNNFGYGVLWNTGFRRALVAVTLTLWHLATFPFVVLWHRPAIIHIHTAPFLVFWETSYYVLVARIFRIPSVLQLHFSFRYFFEVSGPKLRSAMLWVIRKTSLFVVICREDVSFIADRAGDTIRCAYLANFIDVNTFRKSLGESRDQVNRNKDVVVLFLGGSDLVRKGFHDLAEAIRLLSKSEFGVRFLLVAVPRERVEIELSNDLRSRCDIESWVSGDAKLRVFSNADILVLPSHAEGMPITILEAMASSIPVIATNVGGIPDMITHGREGYLINPGDSGALAEAISLLSSDHRRRTQMGEAGFIKALKLHDVRVGIEQLQNLYQEVLGLSCALPVRVRSSLATTSDRNEE